MPAGWSLRLCGPPSRSRAWPLRARPASGPGERAGSVEQLQARFNANQGATQLVVILSPTWHTCRAGASSVHQKILQTYPAANLRVYAIWVSKLFGDARHRWDAAGLTDPRVNHLWDERHHAGAWLVRHQPGYQGPGWDTWLLFGPDATWTATRPPALRGSGYTVVDAITDLDQTLTAFVADEAG